MFPEILNEAQNTLFTAIEASLVIMAIGIPSGFVLSLTKPGSLKNQPFINSILFFLVKSFSSFNFIIIMFSLLTLNSYLQLNADTDNIIVLTLILFLTPKVILDVQETVDEIKKPLIDTGKALGASNVQIVNKIIFPTCNKKLIKQFLNSINESINYSLIAGLIGGSGLGKILYQSSLTNSDIITTFASVLVILTMSYILKIVSFSAS